jgi:crotonobetainyl-CoA:carnitine CoA-transferase CaiB-like acyl-CoA transferase
MAADRGLLSAQRFAAHERLSGELATAMKTRTREEWVEIFTAADVPFGVVRGLSEVAESPQVVARGLLTDYAGVTYVRQPLTLDGLAPGPRAGVPALGEHTAEVLAEVGITRG